VIVDISHACGRTDVVLPLARASVATGADWPMFEVHDPPLLRRQMDLNKLDFSEFLEMVAGIGRLEPGALISSKG